MIQLWLLLFGLLATSAAAADALTCSVPERKAFLRKGGPVVFDAQLVNRGQSILEGRLEASMLRWGRRVSTHVSPEMAIPPGQTVTQMVLPPPVNPNYGEGLAVKLDFVSSGGAIPLGEHRLGKFPEGGEGFVIGIPRGSVTAKQIDTQREQSARLETLRPVLERSAWFETQTQSIPVERAPSQVANWCAYDLVVLDEVALGEMSARQLDTLARWVEAGGRVMIFADGPIGERAYEFVARIAKWSGKAIVLDESRQLPRNTWRLEAGMGRVLLAGNPPATSLDIKAGAWRQHLAWAWKVRPALHWDISNDGVWPVERGVDYVGLHPSAANSPEFMLRTKMDLLFDEENSKPRSMPLSTAAGLLLGLLLLAGPVDWMVLGRLRRRRRTWIVFPVLCAGSAWLAWRIAVVHLGPKARELTVQLVDVGENNQLLREFVLRRRMPSGDEEWVTETNEGVATAQPLAVTFDQFEGLESSQPIPETRVEWQTPSKSALRQNLRQWTINWRHTVSFPPQSPPAAPRWTELIERWKQASRVDNGMVPGDQDDFAIHYIADPARERLIQTDHIRSNPVINDAAAKALAEPIRPLSDILDGDAPRLEGTGCAAVSERSPLVIVVFRRVGDELQIFRRHVSKHELEGSR